MSVLIKGMEMPTDIEPGLVIEFADGIDGKRYARLYHYRHGGLTKWLEAVPVPPHGRLIEESKVLDIVSAWCPDDDGSVSKVGDLREILDEIEALPTIIPASGGNEGEEHTMDEFMYGQEGNPNDGSM